MALEGPLFPGVGGGAPTPSNINSMLNLSLLRRIGYAR